MLQNTTPEGQGIESGNARMNARPENEVGVVRVKPEATGELWTIMKEEEEKLGDNTQGDHSTVSTEWSHDKKVFSSRPSPILEADTQTDPTSISLEDSGFLKDLNLDRKDTESPLNSIDAVHGSDSWHSSQSDSSTGESDSKGSLPTAVNPGKVKDVGRHFHDSSPEASTPRFHDPENSWEALQINDRIQNMHDTMEDIERHPEEYFRDPGSSYQVSARPEVFAKPALDMESDIADKRKVNLASNPMLDRDEGDEHCVEGTMRLKSRCCVIM